MSEKNSFSENPTTEWLVDARGDDRDMRLLEDFCYVDPKGRKWKAPKDSVINGASIPRSLWSTVGSPYTDDYRRASIVHDVACDDPNVGRKDADVMFYHACRAGGCSKRQARLLYLGVRIGAWSTRSLAATAMAPNKSLYRVPHAPSPDEQFIQGKFEEIAVEFETLDKSATVADLDAVIDQHLKF